MTLKEVMAELESYGSENIKQVFIKHGANIPLFGVRVGDLKKLQKKIKKDHDLALQLYDTGNGDAMYLAGLIADEHKITRTQLGKWVKAAVWSMISEYTVAWLAAESRYGTELGLEWIDNKKEHIAAAGWSTLASVASITPDDQLDLDLYNGLLDRVEKELQGSPNRVRYTMNGFVIATGSYIEALNARAIAVGKKVGKVEVDMNGTACKVPEAEAYIKKVANAGRIGKKRKMARC